MHGCDHGSARQHVVSSRISRLKFCFMLRPPGKLRWSECFGIQDETVTFGLFYEHKFRLLLSGVLGSFRIEEVIYLVVRLPSAVFILHCVVTRDFHSTFTIGKCRSRKQEPTLRPDQNTCPAKYRVGYRVPSFLDNTTSSVSLFRPTSHHSLSFTIHTFAHSHSPCFL